MRNMMYILMFGVIVGGLCSGDTVKKVIQMGYDDPVTSFFAANIEDMKLQPFDGTDFFAEPLNPTTRNQFSWQCWGTTVFNRADLQHAVDELNAVGDYGTFTENFLRITVAADKDVTWFVDWFDDTHFPAIVSNMATAAWIIEQGGAKGMMFDAEPYSGQLWSYAAQSLKATKTFAQYQAQVRLRGQQVMQAMQAEDPNLLILLPVSYSYVWGPSQINGNVSELANVEYGLLPAFLDGMLDAAGAGVRFVDVYEASYKFKTLTEFQNAKTVMTTGCLPIVANDPVYAQKFQFGFGLWMDVDWRTGGWHTNPNEYSLNYFTPEEFESALRSAMSVSDEYVWVYSETLFWWNSNGDKNVPHAYKAATRVAQTSEFMEFVPVGDPGNAADTRPVLFLGTNYYFGNVNYMFQIGKYEVTNAQYCAFLNSVAASDPHELYNINMGDPGYYYVETTPLVFRGGILQSGTDGSYTYSTIPGRAHLPVNWVSWRSAARFANWMHNGMQNDPATTEYGAYDASTFVGTGWDKEDQDAHFADAKYWIPTVNEWYKAAFYKGGSLNAGYWTYATQSDTVPGSGPFDVNPNQVNYRADNYDFGDGVDHGDLLSAGFYTASPGPYGTYDQNGNVYELLEEWSPGGYENNLRRRYGGAFWYNDSDQLSYGGMSYDWYGPYYETGFRLVYRGPQCLTPIPGDVYNDCKIDIMDISVLVEHWLDCNLIPQTACQD